MKKRFTLHCWNCDRNYSFLCEVSEHLKATAWCPYCGDEAVVDFNPHKRPVEIYKGDVSGALELLDLPAILPTQKPPAAK